VPGTAGLSEYDPALVDELEGLLEKARLASGAGDETAALAHIQSLDRTLRAHAELPQAAWLMAERLHIEAYLLERHAGQQSRAEELRRAARALEGQRAQVYRPAGEERAPPGPPLPPDPTAGDAGAPVRVSGLVRGDVLEWNGRPSRARLRVRPGPHHVRLLRGGQLAWAQWIDIAAGAPETRLRMPAADPCSLPVLGSTRVTGSRVLAAATRCERWAVARPHGAAAIEIALCAGARCGNLQRWPVPSDASSAPAGTVSERSWPIWAPYALVGAAALAGTGIVLWRLGVFDRDAPEPRVMFSGPAALSF